MIQVKFTAFGANSAFGGFAPGDTLRCSPAMAKHLVEEIGCARYIEAKAPEDTKPAAETKPKRKAK
jgi:hypothetical protein